MLPYITVAWLYVNVLKVDLQPALHAVSSDQKFINNEWDVMAVSVHKNITTYACCPGENVIDWAKTVRGWGVGARVEWGEWRAAISKVYSYDWLMSMMTLQYLFITVSLCAYTYLSHTFPAFSHPWLCCGTSQQICDLYLAADCEGQWSRDRTRVPGPQMKLFYTVHWTQGL